MNRPAIYRQASRYLVSPATRTKWFASMELRYLRYFVAATEAFNFTKATTPLQVAQPALRNQLCSLVAGEVV